MDAEFLEMIEEAVRSRDLFGLAIYAAITLLVALFVVGIARFRVATEIRQINRNFDEVKRQQQELRQATGEIEHTLEIQSAMFKLRSAAYIEKSISAIAAVYDSLLQLRNAALRVAHDDVATQAPEFRNRINAFRSEFDTQRIWIPKDLADYLDGVAAKMSNLATWFIIAEGQMARIEQLSQAQIDEATDQQESFYDFIQEELPSVFQKVVDRISQEVVPETSNKGFNSPPESSEPAKPGGLGGGAG